MSVTPRRPDLSVPRLWCRRRCPGDAGMHLLLLGPWSVVIRAGEFSRAHRTGHCKAYSCVRRVPSPSLLPFSPELSGVPYPRSPQVELEERSLGSAMQDPWHHISHYTLYDFEISFR